MRHGTSYGQAQQKRAANAQAEGRGSRLGRDGAATPSTYSGPMSTGPAPEPRDVPEPRAASSRGLPLEPRKSGLVFDDPLSQQSSDDTDRGWGERADSDSAADLKRFLDEKPPHHL
jgi:hypothetical protein